MCKKGDCTACATHSDCSATQICNYIQDNRGRCLSATGRQWDVFINKVTFPMYDSTGALWDPGGFPDPRIEVAVGGTTTLDVLAYDEDLTSNDYADGTRWSMSIALARACGSGLLFENRVRVEFSIVPVP